MGTPRFTDAPSLAEEQDEDRSRQELADGGSELDWALERHHVP
jgi:hypothetical protein